MSGNDVSVYICDGAGLIVWPDGKVKRDGTFTARSSAGIEVAGTITDDAATGTVSLADGSQHGFTAPAVSSPAGLYRHRATTDGDGNPVVAATIVLPDGSQRGGSSTTPKARCAKIKASALTYLTEAQNTENFIIHEESMAGFHRQTANYINHGCTSLTGPLV